MPQTLQLACPGLKTSGNDFTEAAGALVKADNVVINDKDIIQPRRGYDHFGYDFGASDDRASKFFFTGSNTILHYDTTLAYSTGGAWNSYSGSYSGPSGYKMRFAEANKNVYFTTSAGVYKIDSISQTPETCGVPKAISFAASTTGASGFLANTYYCNYRVLWGIKDANNNYVYGAASDIVAVSNTAGASRNVSLTIYIPDGVTTSHFFQVYRSATSSTSPASEYLGLVYEDNPTASDITNGYVAAFTDIVTDDLRGVDCYVSGPGGIINNNDQPPLAKSLAVFKNCLFFGNTVSKHRYFINLLGTGASTGLQVNDTVVINSVTYTAKASETAASREFKVFTGGSAATDIRDTCLSLCKVVNLDATADVYMFYLSGPTDVPGKMLIEERAIGGSAFPVAASRVTCFSPSSIPTSGTTETSTNDESENTLYYSKQYQPEAVPLTYYVKVGSADKAILDLKASKNALFIFKEDGIFRLTGDGPSSFIVDLLDDTAILIGPETPAIINNQIMALSTQGVVSVSESGVSILSRDIEADLLPLFGSALDTVKNYAFGIGYETDRKYILFLPSSSSDTKCNQAYVYNTITRAWTRWVIDAYCGLVNANDDKLYLGFDTKNTITKERKANDYTDHVEYFGTDTISSVVNTYDVYLSNPSVLEIGDLLYQSSTIFGWVTAIDTVNSYVTVDTDASWAEASVDVYKAIDTSVKWVASAGGNPGAMKHFSEIAFLFKEVFNGEASAIFSSDWAPGEVDVEVTGSDLGLWGIGPWGEFPWGGESYVTPTRVSVPRQQQRCSQLSIEFSHRWGYADWKLSGLSLVFTPGNTRISK
jgi:hypothetical protein